MAALIKLILNHPTLSQNLTQGLLQMQFSKLRNSNLVVILKLCLCYAMYQVQPTLPTSLQDRFKFLVGIRLFSTSQGQKLAKRLFPESIESLSRPYLVANALY